MWIMGAASRRARVARGGPYRTEAELEAHRVQSAERNARVLAEKRALAVNEKLARGCADCGYRAHPEALDWDHLPDFVKLGEISRMITSQRVTVARLRAELAKCEVVCANCHRVRTASRRPTQ